jgi:DMSO/TMAO reductase YedYZ heme-binding membrane subunit
MLLSYRLISARTLRNLAKLIGLTLCYVIAGLAVIVTLCFWYSLMRWAFWTHWRVTATILGIFALWYALGHLANWLVPVDQRYQGPYDYDE